LSFALAIFGWVALERGPDSTVPFSMGLVGLLFGVLTYWRLRRSFILVAVALNALLIMVVALWILSLLRIGELSW
jgi:hypothetical protein